MLQIVNRNKCIHFVLNISLKYYRIITKFHIQIPFEVVHNASIMNAIGCCGLQLYNFGKTVCRYWCLLLWSYCTTSTLWVFSRIQLLKGNVVRCADLVRCVCVDSSVEKSQIMLFIYYVTFNNVSCELWMFGILFWTVIDTYINSGFNSNYLFYVFSGFIFLNQFYILVVWTNFFLYRLALCFSMNHGSQIRFMTR